MELSQQEKQALEVLAEEYENSPEVRLRGMPKHILGARIGAYLNNPIYIVAKLRDNGLVSIYGDRVILTKNGYNHIRPPQRRALGYLKEHSLLVTIISVIVTVIAIAVNLLK